MPNTMPQSDKKHIWTLLWCVGILAVPAFLFAAVADAPHILWLTGFGLAGTLVLRKPLPRTTRTYVYAAVIVATMTVFQQQIFSMEDNRFFLLPAEFYCPALIFLGVVLTYFDQRETTLSAIIGAGIVSSMLAGNTLGPFDENSRFEMGSILLDNLAVGYLIAVAIQAVFLLLLMPNVLHGQKAAKRDGKRFFALRIGAYALAVFLLVGGAVGARMAMLTAAPHIRAFMHSTFSGYFRFRHGGVVFGDKVNLWETVNYKQRNERRILIRALAAKPPGYLRGRVYHRYSNGQWKGFDDAEPLPYEPPIENLASTVYERPGWPLPEEPDQIEVFPAARFRSDVLLVPGNLGEIEIVADDLRSDVSGALYPDEWDEGGGYTVSMRQSLFDSAYPRPAVEDDLRNAYLGIPRNIYPEIMDYAATVFNDEAVGASRRIRELQKHFYNHFAYKLGVDVSRGTDPVLTFLNDKKMGHCELFAASTALLLRSRGIPARYVTGFVCTEPHPYADDYWLARMEDAHAWVEAFLPEERRWVLVEMTPATGIPQGSERFGWFAGWMDRLTMLWRQMMVDLKRGYFARAIIGGIMAVVAGLQWLLMDPVRGPAAAILAAGIAVWGWRRLKNRRRADEKHLPDEIILLRRSVERIEKFLAHYGIRRNSTQTVRELAAAAREAKNIPATDNAAELLDEYEILRYRLAAPHEKTVRSFDNRVRKRLKKGQ